MLSNTDKKFTQISASVDMSLGGPSAVVIDTHELFSRSLKNYRLLIFGQSELLNKHFSRASTILNNRFGLIWNILNPTFISTLKNSDTVLIHGYYLFSTIYSLTIYRGENIYLMPHGTFELYQQSKHTIRKLIFSVCLNFVLNKRKIHFITASETEVAPLKIIFPQNLISVVGLGINIPTLKSVRTKITEEIKMVFLGRIAEKKRIDLCLYTLKLLRSSGHPVSLKVIGTGSAELKQRLLDLVDRLELESVVNFLGHLERNQLDAELSKSDVFLLPSENENFAIAVAESIAAIVPVIVSKEVSMHTFVDKYRVGITLSDLNPELIGQAVLDIMKNIDQYRENCEKYREFLSWEIVFEAWLNTLGLKSNVSKE